MVSLASSLIPRIIFKQSLTTKQRFPECTSSYYQATFCFPPKSSSSLLVPAGTWQPSRELCCLAFFQCFRCHLSVGKKNDSLCPLHGTLWLVPNNQLFTYFSAIHITSWTPQSDMNLTDDFWLFILNLVYATNEFRTFYTFTLHLNSQFFRIECYTLQSQWAQRNSFITAY